MKCSQCSIALPAGHTLCAACKHKTYYDAPSSAEVSSPAAWAARTITEHVFGAQRQAPGPAPPGTAAGLPDELTQIPTRAATDIPGQPEASRLAKLDKEQQERIQGMERGRMWMEHLREMRRVTSPRRD